MKYIFTLAFLVGFLFLFSTSQVFAKDCGDFDSQSDMRTCYCDEYKKHDGELNRLYQEVVKRYKADKKAVASIESAQKAWLEFRDAHLKSVFPESGLDGSAQPLCHCILMAEMTQDRIKQLKYILSPTEGDLCSP